MLRRTDPTTYVRYQARHLTSRSHPGTQTPSTKLDTSRLLGGQNETVSTK